MSPSRDVILQNSALRNGTLGITIRVNDESGVTMQKGRLAGQPNESTVDRGARLAAWFVADAGREEIAAAKPTGSQARLGRGDLAAAIGRLGRARSALADALATLD
jgi:hypothetical protein